MEEKMSRARVRMIASSIQVRKEPKINAESTGYLKRDDVVLLLKKSDDSRWFQVFNTNGLFGWISNKFAVEYPINNGDTSDDSRLFPWMQIALQEVELSELRNSSDGYECYQFHKSTHFQRAFISSSTDNYSTPFVNWCLERSGYEGNVSPDSKNWLYWGKSIKIPCKGCIVLIEGIDPKSGYRICSQVGIFIARIGNQVELISANSNGEVVILTIQDSQVIGYRLPLSF